jgi:ethanolamine utilization protein EutN
MILGRVAGRVTSTIHHPSMQGRTLLMIDKLDPQGAPTGSYLIAVDGVGAGPGETVLVLDEGTGARQILGGKDLPIRSLVVGIVDEAEGSRPASPLSST